MAVDSVPLISFDGFDRLTTGRLRISGHKLVHVGPVHGRDDAGMFGEGLRTGLSVPLVSFDGFDRLTTGKLRMSGLFLLGWS